MTRIHPERVSTLAERPAAPGRFVLYWMQQAARAEDNPALDWAIVEARRLETALVVAFVVTEDYPDANARHFAFLLDGLREVARSLEARRIPFVLRRGEPVRVIAALAADAVLTVCDVGYLRHQRQWRADLAERVGCPIVAVETDVVVPTDRASTKHEYAARTLRPKIMRLIDDFAAMPSRATRADLPPIEPPASDLDPADPAATLRLLKIDHVVQPVRRFPSGARAARQRLDRFITENLSRYADERSRPAAHAVSELSPYLHFGQISPLRVLHEVRTAGAAAPARTAFVEELVVRRELAINHVLHEKRYDHYDCLPDWARRTLADHRQDERAPRYDRDTLIMADTDDRAWNAAMREMRDTGYMHNHLRMYWGKKILEWSRTPEAAFATILELNNRFFLDGRDPNSYANVGWLFGLHDRPWGARPVYGTVRSMSAAGLRRKIDVDAYIADVDRLRREEDGGFS